MFFSAYVLLLPLLSVTFGYEPSADAEVGYDYIVQVEPELLDQLREGNVDAIETNLPPEVNPIRRIRIVIGRETLPKELRAPTAVTRATFRADVDAAAPGIDLLAQTGPAGGFGRNATGFSRRTPTPDTTPAATTIPPRSDPLVRNPPINNTAREIGRQLEAGFENAQDNLARTRDSVRGTVNDLGRGGTNVLDNGRRLLSDVVAPADNRAFDRNGRPIENLAGRTQNELRNTTDAFRDSFGRSGEQLRETLGTTQPDAHDHAGHDHAGHAHTEPTAAAANPQPSDWDRGRFSGDRYAEPERSVLSGVREPRAPALVAPATRPADYRDRVFRDPIAADRGLAPGRPVSTESNLGPAFPARRQETQPAAAFDNFDSRRDNNRVVRSMVDESAERPLSPLPERNNFDRPVDAHAGHDHAHENAAALGAADRGQGSLWNDPLPRESAEVPSIGTVGNDGMNQADNLGGNTPKTPPNSSSSAWLLASAIAAGSVVINMWQFGNMVDIRNKYRVALRRTSPGFARSAA